MSSNLHGGAWRMVVAMALSGTIGLAVIESGLPPLTVVFFRCLIGAAGLLVWLTVSRGWSRMTLSDGPWIVGGGLALVLNWLCLFSAYRYSSISVATVVYHTQPFMLLTLAALLQNEPLQRSRLTWLVLAFAGVALVSDLQNMGQAGASWLGVALACTAAFLYAVATLVTRRLKHLPPAQIAVFQMVVGVLVLLPVAQAQPGGIGALDMRGAVAVLTLGLVHTAFMYTIMYSAFQRLSAQSIAALSFIYPVVALLVDLLYFHVSLHLPQVLGMVAILLAVVADQRKWSLGSLFRRPPAAPAAKG